MAKVLEPRHLRCRRSGKTAYITEERAMVVVERSNTDPKWQNRHGAPARRAYQCLHCGWWHVTKQEKRDGTRSETKLRLA